MTTLPMPAVDTPTPLPGPRGVERLRRLRQLFSDPSTALDGLREVHGPVCGLRLGPMRIAVVGDPGVLHEMFATPAASFRWGNKYNMIGVRFVVGKGSMIVSDGADHHRRRGSVHAAFTRRRLNQWIPMIVQRTDAAIDHLLDEVGTDGADVDMYPVGRRLVLAITLHAFFGDRLTDRADEIGGLFERPQQFIEAPAIRQLPHPFPFTARARVRFDRRAIDKIIDIEIADRRTRPTDNPLDILEAIVTDGSMSDAEIRDQVVTLIGAGYDTTAAALAWMLWCTVLSTDSWSRMRAEADAILGPADRPTNAPDHHTVAGLEYTQRVVHESLRLHPAGLIGARLAATDLNLGGHTIRKGTLIIWSPHLAGRDPATWTNPLRFDPDRFTDMNPEQKSITDQAWVPFGRGPHMCLGFALAQVELTLIIARIAQRLDLTPHTDATPHPIGMVVNRPDGGVRFAARPRPKQP
ncbi:MAG: cytochrome P450 [Ilumatobacteraceae bacterium]